ncbi:serine/threonine protein kinase [Macromonas nakdongensis]|uniref:serine/threonine protein kinase n=1 Tax=Macromonas nakdongensis TaxID=1843082 RepID=UPI000C3338F2|nr:bifunctional serine/threonine-protein kinase/universal stress protein [Macromonas nakdongensis]
MKLLEPGHVIDGFVVRECLHAGGMAHIYRVDLADADGGRRTPGFEMVMKIPRMTAGDGSETIVSFEVEAQILPALTGPHVPRFVAAGDLQQLPYLVMEYVPGHTLAHWLEGPTPIASELIARLGAGLARAVHSLHQQNVCHLDLKPANVLYRTGPDPQAPGEVVLIDFGLSCHAHFPDLLAEELRQAVGSPIWIAPEQVVGIRGDPRSDIFAIGVMLYQLTTGDTPFGEPRTRGGLRQRLWMDPVPPRRRRPDVPAWLQEVILRCLEPEAERRYPSAAHLAFDLSHHDQIAVTERGRDTRGTRFREHLRRWFKAAGMHYQPSPLPQRQISEVPIVMAAVPHHDVSDATLYSLRQAVQRSLGQLPGARLAVVTVISPGSTSSTDSERSETSAQRRYLGMLRTWAQPLELGPHRVSFHVLESGDVASALLAYAGGNHVSLIVMGAATHGLQLQHFVATVPTKVAMHAPCSVLLVKASLPFQWLGAPAAEVPRPPH